MPSNNANYSAMCSMTYKIEPASFHPDTLSGGHIVPISHISLHRVSYDRCMDLMSNRPIGLIDAPFKVQFYLSILIRLKVATQTVGQFLLIVEC